MSMSLSVAGFISTNRILVSRAFAVAFFVLLLVCESAQEGSVVSSILFLSGLVLVGVATVGRLWCSLYISGYKNSELITSGPYSITRNPLYFFSFLGFAGIGLSTESVTFGVAFVLAFALVYPIIIKSEENFLQAKFGRAFLNYCARTPRFFPNFRAFHEPDRYVVNPRQFRKTMIDVLWFIWLVGVVELVEALHEYHILEPLLRVP